MKESIPKNLSNPGLKPQIIITINVRDIEKNIKGTTIPQNLSSKNSLILKLVLRKLPTNIKKRGTPKLNAEFPISTINQFIFAGLGLAVINWGYKHIWEKIKEIIDIEGNILKKLSYNIGSLIFSIIPQFY